MIKRTIPKSGEELPVIGLGTWQTFDVRDNQRAPLIGGLARFTAAGGKVIDSSRLDGGAAEVSGALRQAYASYSANDWTRGREHGIEQMTRSMQLRRTDRS